MAEYDSVFNDQDSITVGLISVVQFTIRTFLMAEKIHGSVIFNSSHSKLLITMNNSSSCFIKKEKKPFVAWRPDAAAIDVKLEKRIFAKILNKLRLT